LILGLGDSFETGLLFPFGVSVQAPSLGAFELTVSDFSSECGKLFHFLGNISGFYGSNSFIRFFF
jgi:hypothetical protein